MMLWIALVRSAAAMQGVQDQPPGAESPEKAEAKKSTISAHFIVSAEGKKALPPGSSIELKGDAATCKNLERPPQHLGPQGTTFPELPLCKVKLWIYITGFETKVLSVDLAKYHDPIRILVKTQGPPVVEPTDF